MVKTHALTQEIQEMSCKALEGDNPNALRIVLAQIDDASYVVALHLGTVVEIEESAAGLTANIEGFKLPITKANLRSLEVASVRTDCMVYHGGVSWKTLHFSHVSTVRFALKESPLPPITLDYVRTQTGGAKAVSMK